MRSAVHPWICGRKGAAEKKKEKKDGGEKCREEKRRSWTPAAAVAPLSDWLLPLDRNSPYVGGKEEKNVEEWRESSLNSTGLNHIKKWGWCSFNGYAALYPPRVNFYLFHIFVRRFFLSLFFVSGMSGAPPVDWAPGSGTQTEDDGRCGRWQRDEKDLHRPRHQELRPLRLHQSQDLMQPDVAGGQSVRLG